jgi:hypothetical protein
MLATAQRKNRPAESRMLAMADRLFNDFDELPVKAVFDAISAARSTLRLERRPATPEAVELLARVQLRAIRMA